MLMAQFGGNLCLGESWEVTASRGRQTSAKLPSPPDSSVLPPPTLVMFLTGSRTLPLGASWLSYKLLLLMAMSPGPVCVSICTPAPCPLPGAWHSTCNCPRGSCRFGACFSLVHTVFLPLLLATSAWKSVPISLGVPVSIRLWPLVGSHEVFPAWLYSVGHEVVQ